MNPSLQESLLKYVVAPAIPILCALLAAALGKLTTYLHSREKLGKGQAALAVLGDLTQSVVADLETSLRPLLQKALEDGKLSPEEGNALKAAALAKLREVAPGEAMETAGKLLGLAGLEQWLSGMVERANAAQPPSVPTPAPAPAPGAPSPT